MDVRRKDALFLAIGLVPALFAAAAAFLLVPDSIVAYAPVAEQLPVQTRFVFSSYYLCVLLPVLVCCIWYFWRNPSKRGPWVAAMGVVGSAAVLAFGWWAVYQPELILQIIKHGSR